jgi:hypothetical protein
MYFFYYIFQLKNTDSRTHQISSDLLKLQSENARLKVLADQKEKEILHLRDPDQETLHQMKLLSDEVTLLRTQTRRLNEEKVRDGSSLLLLSFFLSSIASER